MQWLVEFHPKLLSPMYQARKFLTVLFIAVLIFLFYARSNFISSVSAANSPLQLTWSSAESDYTKSIAWGDYDGDGDLDLATGGSELRIYRNENGALAAQAVLRIALSGNPSIAWGDCDSDGDLDLVVGATAYAGIQLYRNDGVASNGVPIFTIVLVWNNYSDLTTSVAWGDYNGDGRPDLAVGNYGQPNRLFKNINGTLTLDSNWSPPAEQTNSLAWGDVDSDGDLDLAVGNGGSVRLYRNNGGMLVLDAGWSHTYGENRSVAWGDYDADGYLDLAIGGICNWSICNSIIVYHNIGGVLGNTPAWLSSQNRTRSIAWGDYDGDGDLDLTAGNMGLGNQLYRNDGIGTDGNLTFTLVWSSSEGDNTTSIALGDVDNDGDLDLAIGNEAQPNRVYRNDSGFLYAWGYMFPFENGNSVAWGDYDNDGDLDVAMGIDCHGRTDCHSVRLLRNSNGGFLDWYSAESDSTRSIAWGDFNSDGFLDLAVANSGQSRLYYNNGNGLSLVAGWGPSTGGARSVVWGDYDGNGSLDLFIGIDCSTNLAPCRSIRVYRNVGGNLTTNEVWSNPLGYDATRSVALGDYDNDGDLDLAIGNYGQPSWLYRNDGVATNGAPIFTLVWWSAQNDRTNSIAWGDFNGDGRLDLSVGNDSQPNRLYRNDGVANDGNPIFTLVWSSAEAASTNSIALGDYDGDGDLDLASGVTCSSDFGGCGSVRVYRNDGGILTFGAAWLSGLGTKVGLDFGPTYSVAWGDYDNDGDLDLLSGTGISRNNRDARYWTASTPNIRIAYPGAKSDFYSTAEILSSQPIPVTYKLINPRAIPVKNVRAEFSLVGGGKGISSTWLSAAPGPGTDIPPLATTTAYRYTIPPFNWINITTDGTPVTLGDDSVAGPINLGFKFDFFDQAFSQFWISSNGFISFGTPSTSYGNICLPHSSAPANLVAPFWDDLNPAVGGQVYYRKVDADTMVVEWYQVPHHTSSGNGIYTFEAIIRRDGTITFQYLSMAGTLDSATIGIQNNNGTRATQASCNANYAQNNLALRFYNPGQTYTFNWDVYNSRFFGESDNVVFRMVAIPDVRTKPNSVPGPFMYGSFASQTFPFRVRGTQILVMNGNSRVANALVYRLPVGQTGRASAISDANSQPFRTDLMGYLQGRGELNRDDKLVALAPIASTPNYALYYTNAPPNRDGLHMYTVGASGIQTLTVSSSNPLVLLNLDISLEWDARKDKEYLTQLKYDLQRASDFLYDWTNGQVALGQLNIYHDKQNWMTADIRVYASNRFRPNAIQGGIVTSVITDPISPTIEYAPGHVRMGATWNRYGNASGSLGQDWPRALAHELGHYALFLDDDYLGLDPSTGLLVPLQQPYTSECKYTAMTDPYRDDYSEFHYQSNWSTECKDTLAANTTRRWDWATITTFYPLNGTPGATGTGPNSLPLTVTQIKENDPGTPIQTLDDPTFFLIKDNSRYQPGTGARAILYQNDRMIDLGRPTLDQVFARGARIGDRLCVYELAAQRVGCATISSGNKDLGLASVSNWQPDITVSPVTSRTITINVSNLTSGLTTLRARIFPIDATATSTKQLSWTGSQYSVTFDPFDLISPTLEAHVQVWDISGSNREVIADYALQGGPSDQWGEWSDQWGEWAPSGSGDGQVLLFGKNLTFRPNESVVFQATTKLPTSLAGTTLIGQAYRLTTVGTPSLSGASITFQYLGREVPAGETPKIYYWNGTTVTQTNTVVNTYYNIASAFVQGPGVYALMASVDIPLYGPGWNLISYPIQTTQPVTVPLALKSIEPYYTMVYGYVATDKDDHWKLYAKPPIPDQINDLTYLEFGRGYWITVTQNITLALTSRTQRPTLPRNMQLPPSTFYGPLLAGTGFSPTVGMTLTASIAGNPCGQGRTLSIGGQVFYVIDVFAKDIGSYAGCGEMWRPITFKVGTRTMVRQGGWNNSRVQYLPLGLTPDIFLPFIRRGP